MSAPKLTKAQRRAYDELREVSGYEDVVALAQRIRAEMAIADDVDAYFVDELAYQLGREFKRGYDAGRAALAGAK